MKTAIVATLLTSVAINMVVAQPAPKPKEIVIDGVVGFQDTLMQPDGKWHIHDPARPQSPVVTPGTFSQMAPPPSDAVVLFDGKDLSQWRDKRTGGPAQWILEDGVATSAKGDLVTADKFGDVQLHLEFREPVPPKESGQGRGNSGIYFMGLYEVQILDCYENRTYADGATGAIYGQHPALANACRPPGEWQTYDIIFTAPRFGAKGEVLSPAYATVILNGVVVQNHQAYRGPTNWRVPIKYSAHPAALPLTLQYHNNSVSFRNIWVRPLPFVNEP
ncbi:MAG: 3-keto-disaccharide hydrolase [Verrucomicrobiota bacterium]